MWVRFHRLEHDTLLTANNGVEAQNKVLKEFYLKSSHSRKSLTGFISVLVQKFLTERKNNYQKENMWRLSSYWKYSSKVPGYLHNRLFAFIKHIMTRMCAAANFTLYDIKALPSPGTLSVRLQGKQGDYHVDNKVLSWTVRTSSDLNAHKSTCVLSSRLLMAFLLVTCPLHTWMDLSPRSTKGLYPWMKGPKSAHLTIPRVPLFWCISCPCRGAEDLLPDGRSCRPLVWSQKGFGSTRKSGVRYSIPQQMQNFLLMQNITWRPPTRQSLRELTQAVDITLESLQQMVAIRSIDQGQNVLNDFWVVMNVSTEGSITICIRSTLRRLSASWLQLLQRRLTQSPLLL